MCWRSNVRQVQRTDVGADSINPAAQKFILAAHFIHFKQHDLSTSEVNPGGFSYLALLICMCSRGLDL